MSTPAKAGLVSRSVASCFLFKFPTSAKPRVALFRRSTKVKTYQQRLAPISGSIEEFDKSPIAAVWREINEETTLTPANLNLFRQGKPYSFTDESVGRIWTVHPFAFSLKTEDDEKRIQLDWEHEGFSWHDPWEVTDDESFGGVPFLAKSLRRVWFDMDLGEARAEILNDGLQILQGDHKSGARQLASNALEIFRHLVTEVEGEAGDVWRQNARFAAWHLWKNGRENMGAAILNALLRALALIDIEVGRIDGSRVTKASLDRISQHLVALGQDREKSADLVWQSFKLWLEQQALEPQRPLRILTISSSSTVSWCLKQALQQQGLSLDIRILESRPLFEGVSMASKLAKLQDDSLGSSGSSTITLYSDASAAIASRDIDIVLLGADLIDRDGSVSNKTGSLPTVLSAKHVSPKVKVVVLAELEKILPVPAPTQDEVNDGSELAKAWDMEKRSSHLATSLQEPKSATAADGLKVRNVYFEWVPPKLIDAYVSEDGVRDTAGIVKQAGKQIAEADRLFAESEVVV